MPGAHQAESETPWSSTEHRRWNEGYLAGLNDAGKLLSDARKDKKARMVAADERVLAAALAEIALMEAEK